MADTCPLTNLEPVSSKDSGIGEQQGAAAAAAPTAEWQVASGAD